MGRRRDKKFRGFVKSRDDDGFKLKRVKSKLVKFTGEISVTPGGFGFVKPSETEDSERAGAKDGEDVFVPPRHLCGALDGDTVQVALLDQEREPGKGPVGRVVAIIQRGRSHIVGELLAGNIVRPLSKRLPEIRVMGVPRSTGKSDWVRVRLLPDGSKHTESMRGNVEDSFGRAGILENDLMAIVAEHGLKPPYDEKAEAEAAALEPREIERADFTDRICATIDPIDAKDFDDAISIADGPKGGLVELGVHIADVAAWIVPNSKFDKEARSRSFSSYLPGKFMPMLPKGLTRKMCLREGEICPAHSVIFTVDESDGRILSSRRTRSRIKVAKRLDFDGVQDFIEGKPQPDWGGKLTAAIARLVSLTRKMRKLRAAEECFLHIATEEIRVMVDEPTMTIKGLSKKSQKESDKLVEECMLAANSAVAAELIDRGIAGLFRVHQEPDAGKLDEFAAFMADAFGIDVGDISTRQGCNEFLRSIKDDHKRPVIVGAFLRSLPRARYLVSPELHFGLGKMKYSHFTSPIRRYPDLVVHQQLWCADVKGKLRSRNSFELLAEHCSKMEERNDEAYYAANDRMKIHYLEWSGALMEGRLFEAVVSKATGAGLVCDVIELGLPGFVRLDERARERFRKSPKGGKLLSRQLGGGSGHQQYKVGDFVYLLLDRIDTAKGAAVFRLSV